MIHAAVIAHVLLFHGRACPNMATSSTFFVVFVCVWGYLVSWAQKPKLIGAAIIANYMDDSRPKQVERPRSGSDTSLRPRSGSDAGVKLAGTSSALAVVGPDSIRDGSSVSSTGRSSRSTSLSSAAQSIHDAASSSLSGVPLSSPIDLRRPSLSNSPQSRPVIAAMPATSTFSVSPRVSGVVPPAVSVTPVKSVKGFAAPATPPGGTPQDRISPPAVYTSSSGFAMALAAQAGTASATVSPTTGPTIAVPVHKSFLTSALNQDRPHVVGSPSGINTPAALPPLHPSTKSSSFKESSILHSMTPPVSARTLNPSSTPEPPFPIWDIKPAERDDDSFDSASLHPLSTPINITNQRRRASGS
jgi:hypothetical protein